MLPLRLRPLACASLLATTIAVTGCSKPQSAPKQDLSEQEKQQVRELNEQRAEEWGPKRK